ncbi:diguanylate cyclase [Hydrogenobaculum acidophilum]
MSKKLNAHDKFMFILTPTVVIIVLAIFIVIFNYVSKHG